MSEIKVSVVMPVYNVSKYLKEALDCVVNQTLKEIEIICVDDGSTDDSFDILKEYADKDSRIKVLQQKNQFAGVARNNGLKMASGKYVVFWDADDLFDKEALEKLYEEAERTSAEIVICGANRYDTVQDEIILTNVYLVKERLPEKRPFSRQDMGKYIYNFAANVPWNKIYLREFIHRNHLEFEARIQANDTYFVMMAFYYAKVISVVEDKLINYRISTEVSVTDKVSKTPLCAYESYETVLRELETKEDYTGDLKQSFLNKALNGFMLSLSIQKSFAAFRTVYQHLLETGFSRFEIDQHDQEYYYSAWAYEDFLKMQEISPEDFLIGKLKGTKEELKVKNSRIAKLRQRRDELKENLSEVKTTLREVKTTLKEVNAALKNEKKIVREQSNILNSRTVRYALKMKQIVTLNGRLSRKSGGKGE